MTQLPIEFQHWLTKRNSNEPVTLNGYIQFAAFRPLDQVVRSDIFVSVDEYISNYSDSLNHLAGKYYPISVYDLLSDLYGYEPHGVLVWVPTISQFGTFDNDHGVLRSFPNKTWTEMMRSLDKYIDCQWYPERIPNELVRPWRDQRFKNSIPTETPPW
ncbi:MAG: hypothetical protein AAF939_09025 [Planctomycetota bacterium]